MPQVFKVGDPLEERLILELANTVRSGNFEPPQLPHLAMEVLDMTRDPNVSMRHIGGILAKDQVLTAKVLHMANSAYYPGSGNISSLARAMAHMGLDGLKQLLFMYAFKGTVFRSREYQEDMKRCWQHSVGCALASDLIAKSLRKETALAFVAGLVHDIGKPVALAELIRMGRKNPDHKADREMTLQLVDRMHCAVGALIGSRWKLPDPLRSVIEHHHKASTIAGPNKDLVKIVAAGDTWCRLLGLGYELDPKARKPQFCEMGEFAALGLTNKQIEDIGAQLASRSEALSSI